MSLGIISDVTNPFVQADPDPTLPFTQTFPSLLTQMIDIHIIAYGVCVCFSPTNEKN